MDAVLSGAFVLAVLIGLDQMGLWAERRGWIYWRKRMCSGSADAGVAMLGVMDALFSPATRNTVEEIAGKKNGRIDLSVGEDEWIDLDRGRVHRPTTSDPIWERTDWPIADDGRP